MSFSNKAAKPKPFISAGQDLTEKFKSAMVSIAVIENAKMQATASEGQALQNISAVETGANSIYVTPQDIAVDSRKLLAHYSLDANLKKIQAGQIEHYTKNQLAALDSELTRLYKDKRAVVTILERRAKPLYLKIKSKTGQEHYISSNAKTIKGTISSINTSSNLIVLKPLISTKLLHPEILHYEAFVINPENLAPLIKLSTSGK